MARLNCPRLRFAIDSEREYCVRNGAKAPHVYSQPLIIDFKQQPRALHWSMTQREFTEDNQHAAAVCLTLALNYILQ